MARIQDADACDQASFDGTPPDRAKDDGQHLGDGTTPVVVDIVADVRERPSDTFETLRARPDVVLTVATLKYGDYSLASQLSIERKSADDLGRSIIDGRLFRQMSALRRRAQRPVLLIEGLQPHGTSSGVPWHAVRGALVSVAVVFGVPILLAEGAPRERRDHGNGRETVGTNDQPLPRQARLPAEGLAASSVVHPAGPSERRTRARTRAPRRVRKRRRSDVREHRHADGR